ncbi:MAG TPA: hypothetical protein VHW74_05195 [Mycobacteriales bacterium]|nr:hypothetical protein [Mycobacteriales bacterium]
MATPASATAAETRPTEPAPVSAPIATQSWEQATSAAAPKREWRFDPEKLVVGDWVGALIAALSGLVVMLAFAAAIAGIDPTPHVHAGGFIHQMLALVMLMVGGAVKIASNDNPIANSGSSVIGLSVTPLLASAAGFSTMAIVFTRRLKRSPTTAASFLLQAVRLLLVVVLLLIAVSIAARGGHSTSATDYVRVRGPYSVFFGACMTMLALVITFFFGFGEAMTGRAALWRARLLGPAIGIVALILVSFVASTIYALIQILADPQHLSTMSQLGLISDNTSGRKGELDSLLAFGLNNAMWMLSWGMGIPLRVAFLAHSHKIGLTRFTDQNGLYWLVPVATAAMWLTAAGIAHLYSATPIEGRRNGYRLPILAPVLTTRSSSSVDWRSSRASLVVPFASTSTSGGLCC